MGLGHTVFYMYCIYTYYHPNLMNMYFIRSNGSGPAYLKHEMGLVLEDLDLELVAEAGHLGLEKDQRLHARVLSVVKPKTELNCTALIFCMFKSFSCDNYS